MFFFHVVGRFLPGKSLSTALRRTPVYCRPLCPVPPARSVNIGYCPSAATSGLFALRAANRAILSGVKVFARSQSSLVASINTNKSPRPRVNLTHLGLRFW